MRVVIAGDYPEHPPTVVGGIQAVIYNTLIRLSEFPDLDIHLITCEKWRDPASQRPRVVEGERWTVHYLPSSPRLPHTLTMLTADRWAIRRQIRALAPAVIHAHGQAAAYPFAAFDAGLPALVTVHGINALEAQVDPRGGALKAVLRTRIWGLAEHRCLQRASDIVVISPFVREVIGPHTTARLHVVENPVHDDFFAVNPAPVPGKVLLVGSIQKRKGILEAIQAMHVVRRSMPQAELYLAGAFTPAYREYGDLVRRTVAEAGAGSYVHFLGHAGHNTLVEAYRTSQVFVLPSYLEASPVVLAEAMTAGLPSVVSDIGSTTHLVEEGITGYRVPAGDVGRLAGALLHLLQDPVLCSELGQRARRVAEDRFTARLAAQKTRDLYLALASSSPRVR
ncbi:MAG TPA: glycosyltransferase family 4 protein [Anaerolineae bacterium]|nr:glycosyltransferase family 4 protein [Anaerolineae bacterium]